MCIRDRCYPVARPNLGEQGLLLPADLLAMGAACMEPAPLGRIDGAGDSAGYNDPFLVHLRVRLRDSGNKGLGIRMEGITIQFVTVSQLHHFSQIHDSYPVTDMFHRGHTVGDEDVRCV